MSTSAMGIFRFFVCLFLLLLSSASFAIDTDNDGLPDEWEDANGLNKFNYTDTETDNDGDGLSALKEFNYGTSPNSYDTDRDTMSDGWEIDNNLNPLSTDYHIEVGDNHSCAIFNLEVICWGKNDSGQTEVPALINPSQVSAGNSHTCALDDSGVVCWGNNEHGQVDVPDLSNPTQIFSGYWNTCALDDSGVVCWGSNDSNKNNVPFLSNPTYVSLGGSHTCALDDSGVVCWGYGWWFHDMPEFSNPKQISLGGGHTCVLDDFGVSCRGKNHDGQIDVPELSNPSQISAGNFHTCALDDTGVVCWGKNWVGQANVPELVNPAQVSAGTDHTCALDQTGIVCWGSNSAGQVLVPNLIFDLDRDAVNNHIDVFPIDGNETSDNDNDGIGDNADSDDDNDGVDDNQDAYPFNALYSSDTDNDGMPNDWEVQYGLDPNNRNDAASDIDNDGSVALQEFIEGTFPGVDADNDGLSDDYEISTGTNPNDADSDDDGANDKQDTCPLFPNDNQLDTDGDNIGDACDSDADNDGIPNDYEIANGLNPVDVSDAQSDIDMDGLTVLEEFNLGTSLTNVDTDGDGLKDNIDFDPLGRGYFVDRYLSPLELQNLFSLSDRSTSIVDDYLVIEQGGFHNEILYRIPVSNENGSSLDGYFRVEIEMIEQRNFGSSDKDLLVGISDGENVILFTNNDTSNGGAWIGKDLGTTITETSSVGFGYNLEHYLLLFEWVNDQAELTVKAISDDEGYIQSSLIGSPGEIDLSKSIDLVLVGNASNEDYRLEGINILFPDIDMDGLTNIEESNLGTSPTNDDTDRDTLPDGWEVENGKDPLVADYQISSGNEHSCVLIESRVVCWGRNGSAQIEVPTLTNPTKIVSGRRHNCILDEIGVICWGSGDEVLNVPELNNPTEISSGSYHLCVLDDSGLVCWGSNNYGQLDDIPDLTNPSQISLGEAHSCAIDDTGVVCWGNNNNGQSTVPNLQNPRLIAAGYGDSCAIDDTGVVCWGSVYQNVPALNNPIDIKIGSGHICALDDSGVVCWGSSSNGQLETPQLSNPASIHAGYGSTCALDDFGFSCWGFNNFGKNDVPNLVFDPDNDGFSNQNGADPFPLDATEWLDTDSDGIGNNADLDDDNDGFEDTLEIQNGLDPLVANPDIDNDGIANELDPDNDNDGTEDAFDSFPINALEQLDHDKDGVGNNADTDDDGDGVNDALDLFPLDAFESADSDGDGIGDNADFFPSSTEYSLDSDLDQMPDAWERKYGLNPTDASDALLDQDNDGLTALEEYEAGTIPLKILDIDANGSFDALTDGLIILRYAFGLRGEALVNEATANDAMRDDAADVEAYLNSLVPGL